MKKTIIGIAILFFAFLLNASYAANMEIIHKAVSTQVIDSTTVTIKEQTLSLMTAYCGKVIHLKGHKKNRPQRNFNPCNMKYSTVYKTRYSASKEKSGAYTKFRTEQDGFSATYDVLFGDIYSEKTLRRVLHIWSKGGKAPLVMSNNYSKTISKLSGLKLRKMIDKLNAKQRSQLIIAMCIKEGYFAHIDLDEESNVSQIIYMWGTK